MPLSFTWPNSLALLRIFHWSWSFKEIEECSHRIWVLNFLTTSERILELIFPFDKQQLKFTLSKLKESGNNVISSQSITILHRAGEGWCVTVSATIVTIFFFSTTAAFYFILLLSSTTSLRTFPKLLENWPDDALDTLVGTLVKLQNCAKCTKYLTLLHCEISDWTDGTASVLLTVLTVLTKKC